MKYRTIFFVRSLFLSSRKTDDDEVYLSHEELLKGGTNVKGITALSHLKMKMKKILLNKNVCKSI